MRKPAPSLALVIAAALSVPPLTVEVEAADFRPLNLPGKVDLYNSRARLSTVPGHVSLVVRAGDWTNGDDVFDWSPDSGLVAIGHVPPTSQGNSVTGISADGGTVVGKDLYGGSTAFRWTPAGGRQTLGTLPGGPPESVAEAVSADGSVIVGVAGKPVGGYMPIRWTYATGMQPLGYLPGFSYDGTALGVSANGQYVVGIDGSGPSSGHAFRWDAANGLVEVGDLPGGMVNGRAFAVSDDGSVVTGQGRNAASRAEAFRWTPGSGITGLGTLSSDSDSSGTHVSGDGMTILGTTDKGAFIWTQATGMRKLQDVLAAGGAVNMTGWNLTDILDVSDDGTRIVGLGNKGMFVADLLAPPVPVPPEAVDDGPVEVVGGELIDLTVARNDTGFIPPLTVTVITPPAQGDISGIDDGNGDPVITFVPDEESAGPDSFVYRVTDATGATDTAMVRLQILPRDTVPDAFEITVQENVAPMTWIDSEEIYLNGMNAFAPISVQDGEYSIDGGEFTTLPGLVEAGIPIIVRHRSAATALTSTTTVLTVGGVSGTFTSMTGPPGPDEDDDGVADAYDNCTFVPNPTQCDSDEDGYGNHCDGDLTGNGITNAQDGVLLRNLLGAGTPGPVYNVGDLNCNGVVNAQDTTIFRRMLGEAPGPSGFVEP